ncbi:hypothetical protein PLICRDRAFT_38102 [Plicaturopsis crispa FD-325 SS-3]|nr:hypothetical protein PLICRDRAFT_38102 [Plicaturopsis crispa FD-325 SS-3]
MREHIQTVHPDGYSCNNIEDGVLLPSDLALAMFITVEEEQRIGIPKENSPETRPPVASSQSSICARNQAVSTSLSYGCKPSTDSSLARSCAP